MNFCLLMWERGSQALNLQLSGRFRMLVIFQGAKKRSLIHCGAKAFLYPSTTPAGRLGVLALQLQLQLQLHPSTLQKVCCTEKFHQSSNLKYMLPICVTVHSLLIFTSENLLCSSIGLIAFMSELLETKILGQPQISHSNEMFPV